MRWSSGGSCGGLRPGLYPQLAELASCAAPGSDRYRVRQQAGWAALWASEPAKAVELFTTLRDAVADRPPCRALADALVGRSAALRELGQVSEALQEGRLCLAVVREVDFPLVEVVALAHLAMAAAAADDVDEAVRLARQMDRFTGRVPPSIARACSGVLVEMLIQAGDFAAAERVCAAVLAACRDVGDVFGLAGPLSQMTLLDLRAGRPGDATVHLRESLQLALRAGTWQPNYLDCCGHLCAATGRNAEAVTAWAAWAALVPAGDDWPGDARRRQGPLRAARRVLGPERARAAEERGAGMSRAAAAEYTVLLALDRGPRQAPAAQPAGRRPGAERAGGSTWKRGARSRLVARLGSRAVIRDPRGRPALGHAGHRCRAAGTEGNDSCTFAVALRPSLTGQVSVSGDLVRVSCAVNWRRLGSRGSGRGRDASLWAAFCARGLGGPVCSCVVRGAWCVVTAALVRDGLAAGLQVMWLSDDEPQLAVGELARRGIAA